MDLDHERRIRHLEMELQRISVQQDTLIKSVGELTTQTRDLTKQMHLWMGSLLVIVPLLTLLGQAALRFIPS